MKLREVENLELFRDKIADTISEGWDSKHIKITRAEAQKILNCLGELISFRYQHLLDEEVE